MDIKVFSARIAEDIVDYLPAEVREKVSVEPVEVMKINDQVMHGLTFHIGDEPAPTYYLDDLFNLHRLGMEPEEIMQQLADAYTENGETGPKPEEIPNLEFRRIRQKAGLRLVGMEYNQKFLETVPYRDVGNGYALICDLQISAIGEGVFSTVVTNTMAEDYDYDMDKLFDIALDNAWRKNAASLRPASELMDEEGQHTEREICYVLTTDRQRFGAAALFYPGTQAMIAHVLEEDYVAIPSSLHEFLILRKSRAGDLLHLQHMVEEANRIIVSPDEVLSDGLLEYSRSKKQLTRVQTACIPRGMFGEGSLLEADNGLVLDCGHTV